MHTNSFQLLSQGMGYEQLFWIQLNYVNKRQFERQELLAPAEQSTLQAKGKLRKLWAPEGNKEGE